MADPQTAEPPQAAPRWAAPPPAAPATTPDARRRTTIEIWILLGLSLGQSGVYAIVNIIARLSADTPLAQQTATLNASQSDRSLLDLTYQLLGIVFALVPVALALYLLSARTGATWRGTRRRVGLDWGLDGARPGRDLAWGVGLAALIGIPGLAFYLLGRLLGITVAVQASALNSAWWTVPVLIVSAFQNGLLEEVVAVAYLRERTRDLGWHRLWFVVWSSLLRGSYHLYQGIGPFFGNVVMGVVFSWFYTSRWGRHRVLPLVVAHTLLDVVAFVGYALLPAGVKDALGL